MAILKNEQLGDIGMFYKTYEPKTKNRFYFDIEGIPAYLVKKADRPKPSFEEITLDHINLQRKLKGEFLGEILHVNCMILLIHQVLKQ